jgi:hypothetical protein
MLVWRAHGRVTAKRQSSCGTHIVLHATRLEFCGVHRRNVPYLLILCTKAALVAALEARLREGDLVHLAGVIEPRTRPKSPIIKRDWDVIVIEAKIPRLSNLRRRLLRR